MNKNIFFFNFRPYDSCENVETFWGDRCRIICSHRRQLFGRPRPFHVFCAASGEINFYRIPVIAVIVVVNMYVLQLAQVIDNIVYKLCNKN